MPQDNPPLSRFICDMWDADNERLRAMDTARAAKHYGARQRDVENLRAWEMQLRGIR